MTGLQRLDIHAFRGLTDGALPFDGGSIVLGGGNGTGKSAFVDALEFLYTGSVATLSGTQGLSLRQHGPHIHARLDESYVTAHYVDPPGCVTRRLMGPLEVSPGLEPHMDRGARLAFILRRSQLQQFIHAKPADRYRSMADLIGAEHLDRTEAALKGARDALERDVQQGEAQLAQVARQLDDLAEDVADDQLIREASEALDALGVAHHLESVDDVARIRAEALRAVSDHRPDPRQEARARLAAELRRGVGEARLREVLSLYRSLVTGPGPNNQDHLVDLLQLLRSGREYLRETHVDNCPLCEREIAGRALFGRLVERVAALEEVSLREQRLRQGQEELTSALQDVASRLRALERVGPDAGLSVPAVPLLNAGAMLQESARAGARRESAEMASRTEDALDRWEAWSREAVAAIDAPQTADDGSGDETGQIQAILAILEGLTVRRARAERGRQELQRLVRERERLAEDTHRVKQSFLVADGTYHTFNRVKNAEIQRVYDDLRGDLARMYDFLHPGEGHQTVAIAMDPRKRGSSDLKMGFYGRDGEDPRAFASEGHLDSLGLCIFLAFVKRFNGAWPLLVLDDVVTSVDAAHKGRVARLLFGEFGDRQLFITTHDSRWFMELRKAQEESGHRQVHNLVIDSWSLAAGPSIREPAL